MQAMWQSLWMPRNRFNFYLCERLIKRNSATPGRLLLAIAFREECLNAPYIVEDTVDRFVRGGPASQRLRHEGIRRTRTGNSRLRKGGCCLGYVGCAKGTKRC